jgi:hypothetical protein
MSHVICAASVAAAVTSGRFRSAAPSLAFSQMFRPTAAVGPWFEEEPPVRYTVPAGEARA